MRWPPSSPNRCAGRTTACLRPVTFCWRATSRRSPMRVTRLLPTAASPWKKSWFRSWRSPERTHEEGRRHSPRRSSGSGWTPCWIGSCRRPTRRNSGNSSITHSTEDLPGKESRAKAIGISLANLERHSPEASRPAGSGRGALAHVSPGKSGIWLHWGMTALAYPFFRDAAEVVGRLLALQDDFTTAQVQDPDR